MHFDLDNNIHLFYFLCSDCNGTYSKVEEVESRDVAKLPLGDLPMGDNVYALEVFDRIIGEVDYKGKTYPVKTDKLNNELYYVGYFYSLKDIKELRSNSVCEEFINRGWAGEIVCQVAKSKVVPKEELETALAHLITPPHIKFKSLEELKARRAKSEKAKDDSEIVKNSGTARTIK